MVLSLRLSMLAARRTGQVAWGGSGYQLHEWAQTLEPATAQTSIRPAPGLTGLKEGLMSNYSPDPEFVTPYSNTES